MEITCAGCLYDTLQLRRYSYVRYVLRTRVDSKNSCDGCHHGVDGDTERDQVRGVGCHPHHQSDHEDRFQR